jgi:hypothetical protein
MIPPFEHRLWDCAVRQPLEPGTVSRTQSSERLVGGGTDRDVIWVPEDAVRAERHDNSGILLFQDLRNRADELAEGNLGNAAVR